MSKKRLSMVSELLEKLPPRKEPVVGEIVSYYLNGTRYGKVEAIHPRNKTVDILPFGGQKKSREGSSRAKAGLPRLVNIPLSDVGLIAISITIEPGESIDDRADYGDQK